MKLASSTPQVDVGDLMMNFWSTESISKKNGYTLVEVTIVTGILALSILAWAEMANRLSRSAQQPDAQLSRDSVASMIRETLKFQTTCNTALIGGGKNASGFEPGSILRGISEVQMLIPGIYNDGTPNDDVIARNSRVQKIVITSLHLANAINVGPSKYFAQVRMESQVAATRAQLRPVDVGAFYFTTVGGNALLSCDNTSTDPTPLCVEMGCTWNPAATPACQCQPIDLSCPPQQYLTGVAAGVDALGNPTSNPICTPLGNGPCQPGYYLRGISIGVSDCAPLPP